jgi:hypothetical protein
MASWPTARIRTSTWPTRAGGPGSCCSHLDQQRQAGAPRGTARAVPHSGEQHVHHDAARARHVRPARRTGERRRALAVVRAGFPGLRLRRVRPRGVGLRLRRGRASNAIDALFSRICHPEHQWAVRFEEPDAAVLRAMQVAQTATRPVILADTQDNPGVGGDSNTTGLLRALLKHGAQDAAIGLICDPAAAAAAHAAGVGRMDRHRPRRLPAGRGRRAAARLVPGRSAVRRQVRLRRSDDERQGLRPRARWRAFASAACASR